MEDILKIWDSVLNILEDKIPASTFEPWILPLVPHDYDGSQFTVLCGQSLAVQILQKPANHSEITKALASILGKEVEFRVMYDEDLSKKLKKKSQKAKKEDLIANIESKLKPAKYDGLMQMQSSYNLNLKYKFENFVVGANNKFAYGASMTVAKEPGKKYNPLFLYGGSGLGKTHLMQAIGHYILYNNPELKVKYVKTEEFVNDLVNSLFKGLDKSNKMNKFREKYRNVDVLLIDDIQFIESKERTQIEIFNTFETLHNSGKQIVITSDRDPENLPLLSDRLRSRFQMGLIADLQVPDLETRMAILSKLATDNNVDVPVDVIEFLAIVYKNNIRELEGAFNRVSAYSGINEVPINIENVKKIINYSETKKNITTEGIMDVVAEFYNVPVEEIKGSSRHQKIAMARQVAVYLTREITQESFPQIGEAFCKKHTTILYSYEKVKEEMTRNKSLSEDISILVNKINQ